MRVEVIRSSNLSAVFQGGRIGVVGSTGPIAEETKESIHVVSRYALDGWAIAADLSTPIGMIAALTAEAACVPFVPFDRLLNAVQVERAYTTSPQIGRGCAR